MRAHSTVAAAAFVALLSSLHAQTPPSVLKVVGERHKLVLRSDGSGGGWGALDNGQLGPIAAISAERNHSTGLVPITLPAKAIDIAAAYATSYALLEDGTVMAWGLGRDGQLGNGPAGPEMKVSTGATGSERPVKVSGLSGVIQIAAGDATGLALLADGTVRAWGSRKDGTVGDGRHPQRYLENGPPALVPVVVPNAVGIAQLSAGSSHVLALTADGRVLAWGSNHYGALGRAPRQELPIDAVGEVPGLIDVMIVASGQGVSTVLKKDGTVWVWGANWHGQFGNGQRTSLPGMTSGFELVPQSVPGIANVTSLSVGITGRHTLVLLKDGTLRGWGNTDWGQLGAGVSGTFQEKPVSPKIADVKAIFAAGNNSFAVKRDGSLWMWGAGDRNGWPLQANTKLPVPMELK